MKSKLWNGGFLRTVRRGWRSHAQLLLALSALGAGLTLGGVIGQQQLSAAAVVISFLGVFPGAWLTGTACRRQKLPAAIVVGVCCLAVCMLARAAVLQQSGGADPARDACDACRGGSGRDRREHAAKACPAQKKMTAFLHASKSKLYLHFMHQRAGLPSFQDFDFTHEFRHYMLCFL